jgi:hypothetical protein
MKKWEEKSEQRKEEKKDSKKYLFSVPFLTLIIKGIYFFYSFNSFSENHNLRPIFLVNFVRSQEINV